MPKQKITFSLDEESFETLDALSRQWQVSKPEAVRRAIRMLAEPKETLSPEEKIAVLHHLQRRLKDRNVDFAAWQRTIRSLRK